MNWITRTLWDFIERREKSAAADAKQPQRSRSRPKAPAQARSNGAAARRSPRMQERYDALVREMKQTYGIRVRKWRTSSSGCAWEIRYTDGRIARLIESPYPKGPMSCAIFLHEIGHHAIGFKTYRPRCLEEYHAWKWSLDTMRERGLNITAAVERRMAQSLFYAIAKARRRGLRNLPPELIPYADRNGIGHTPP